MKEEKPRFTLPIDDDDVNERDDDIDGMRGLDELISDAKSPLTGFPGDYDDSEDFSDFLSNRHRSLASLNPDVALLHPPVKQPIPANRQALLREIEEENQELRRRRKIREIGHRVMIVVAIILGVALVGVIGWMAYVGLAGSRLGGGAAHKKATHRLKPKQVFRMPVHAPSSIPSVMGQKGAKQPMPQGPLDKNTIMIPKINANNGTKPIATQ